MGRVYTIESHPGLRVYGSSGAQIIGVTRIEFDADEDNGDATVTAFLFDSKRQLVLDPETMPVQVTFRALARVRFRPEAPARLWPLFAPISPGRISFAQWSKPAGWDEGAEPVPHVVPLTSG